MVKNGIKSVEKALERGFSSKGAKVSLFTEKSDYKDFIRMFVVSDSFRNKTSKERLGEIFSILEEFGAKDAIGKISLCVALTRREFKREFGPGFIPISHMNEWYQGMRSRPRHTKLSRRRLVS